MWRLDGGGRCRGEERLFFSSALGQLPVRFYAQAQGKAALKKGEVVDVSWVLINLIKEKSKHQVDNQKSFFFFASHEDLRFLPLDGETPQSAQQDRFLLDFSPSFVFRCNSVQDFPLIVCS